MAIRMRLHFFHSQAGLQLPGEWIPGHRRRGKTASRNGASAPRSALVGQSLALAFVRVGVGLSERTEPGRGSDPSSHRRGLRRLVPSLNPLSNRL